MQTERTCPTCQRPHPAERDCTGKPIDWAARKERARAFVRGGIKTGKHWADKGYKWT